MKMKNEENIKKTLNSLDTIQPAKAADHFYEKLKMRMQSQQQKVINLRKDFRWQAVAAAILLLFSVNVVVMLNVSNYENREDTGEAIANEYDLLPNSSYELLSTYQNN